MTALQMQIHCDASRTDCADLRAIGREIESGSALGLHLSDLLANRGHVALFDDANGPATRASNNAVYLQKSQFLFDLLAAFRSAP